MSYQVLALKYRPQTFNDVIGQEHVTTTLINAIASDRVAHALLFTGPRGTGKTTIARILAKAVNCSQGPGPEPCNTCNSCKTITSGHASDVFEIDGASNNSVDQVRELRENVTYMPASSPYKIYIIDEVHMLSTAAFNALLKTLEEPPDHVIFIFATTEPHKIPVTILSRCQRHDLSRIPFAMISAHLRRLCDLEDYTLSDESIDVIASQADGSMRDGLSLLDRILSSSADKAISHDQILQDLGIIDKSIISNIASAVISSDGKQILSLIDKAYHHGMDLKKLYAAFVRYIRNLLVIKICKTQAPAGDLSDHEIARMASVVEPLSQLFLTQILSLLIAEESLIKNFSHTRTALELIFLKLVQIRPGSDIDDIIQKLDLLAATIDNQGMTDKRPESQVVSGKDQIKETEPLPPATELSPQLSEQEKPEKRAAAIVPEKKAEKPHLKSTKISSRDWNSFLQQISTALPSVWAILEKGNIKQTTGNNICLELTGSAFDFKRIEVKKKEIETLCQDYFGKSLTIIERPADNGNGNIPEKTPAALRQESLSHPLIAEAVRLFNINASSIDVKSITEEF